MREGGAAAPPGKNSSPAADTSRRTAVLLYLRPKGGGRDEKMLVYSSSSLRTAISSKQSPLCLGTPVSGHSSPAPLLLLSKRHPLRWAAVWGPPAAAHSSSSLRTAMNASVGNWTVPKVRIFFLPAQTGQGPFGYPGMISMLGRSEFALRQGFCLRQKRLYGAMRRPTLWGPRKANENALLTPRPA